jgi:hypothetical protein
MAEGASSWEAEHVLREKPEALLRVTTGRQRMLAAEQDAEDIPRELEEVSVRMEDASRVK